jgi:hypothetical protein
MMTAVGQTRLDTKRFGLADKVRHRARIHLAHHLSAVDLHGNSAQVISEAICLFNSLDSTKAITSFSRGESDTTPAGPPWQHLQQPAQRLGEAGAGPIPAIESTRNRPAS